MAHVPSSPLRYPGGKQVLAPVLASIIETNGFEGCTYAEPYAGGAGAALTLLFSEHVGRIWLNDADQCIFAFWKCVLNETERFLKLLRDTPLTIAEWKRQREVYRNRPHASLLQLAFATFYLNRTNRSGVIKNGGAIGGLAQTGKWRLDARFNRRELSRRIAKIACYKERIRVTNIDALQFMRREIEPRTGKHTILTYLDPPYYNKGCELYLNYYSEADHQSLADYILCAPSLNWVLTYDRSRPIMRMYSKARQFTFKLPYSAYRRRDGHELLIVGEDLNLPSNWRKHMSGRGRA